MISFFYYLYELFKDNTFLYYTYSYIHITHYRTRTDNPIGADFESAVFTNFTK